MILWLVVFLNMTLFFRILGIIIPIDELIFFRGVETTNQDMIYPVDPSGMPSSPNSPTHQSSQQAASRWLILSLGEKLLQTKNMDEYG